MPGPSWRWIGFFLSLALSWPFLCRSAWFRFCGGPQTTGHRPQITDHPTHTRHPRQVLAGGNTDDDVDGGGGHGLQCRVIRVMGICMSCGAWVLSWVAAPEVISSQHTQAHCTRSSTSTAWIISTVTTEVVGPQRRVTGGAGGRSMYGRMNERMYGVCMYR